jgi:16S rRNA (guanine527-N7)-methyltransferase
VRAEGSRALVEVLLDAQTLGFMGPGAIEPHLAHAKRFAAAVGTSPGLGLDLGSGGGLPGLALALAWPDSEWVLLDANARRAEFLNDSVQRLGLEERVVVDHRRAELAGRDSDRRGRMTVVVARAFGRPSVVAECGAPFLVLGGLLVVSEPPEESDRWPAEEMAGLGLESDPPDPPGFVRFRQIAPCPDRYPRRDGVPAKRPLF